MDLGKLLMDAISAGIKAAASKGKPAAPAYEPTSSKLARDKILAGLKDKGYVVQMMSVPFDKSHKKGVDPGSAEGLRVLIGPPGTDFGSRRAGGFGRLEGLYDAGGPFRVHPSIVDDESVMRALKRYRNLIPGKPVNLPGLDLSS